MFCPRCGGQNPDSSRFCIACGTSLSGSTPVQTPPRETVATRTDNLLGQTIDGKYRLDAQLGEGGMGTVYRAIRLNIGDSVAIKVLHQEQLASAQGAERFRREAHATARLKHPNAVTIHDFGISSGLLYLVMELAEGQSLRKLILQEGKLAPPVAGEIISQACSALDEAHRFGIVHRDIKPDNIMVNTVSGTWRVKVLDFGIAKLRALTTDSGDAQFSHGGTLTQVGSVIGTPHYMSPEQCVGEELDGRSDIYSTGIVLYEMLTGRLPFNAQTSRAIIAQHISQPPPPLRSVNPAIAPEIEAVVMKALSKEREDRQQTAMELARSFVAAIHQTAPVEAGYMTAPPPSMPTPESFAPATQSVPGFATQMRPPVSAPLPMSGTTEKPRNWLPLVLVALIVIGLGAAAVYYLTRPKTKEAILAEVNHGNLVKPEGLSAYDLYLKHVKSDLSREDVLEISSQVIAPLEKRGDEIFNALMIEASEAEADWQESSRIYAWLNELKPTTRHESQMFFAQARLNLLRRDFNGALAGFKRASTLEPKWAAPLNGLGRAWVGLKDKVKARDCYQRAASADPKWISPLINLATLSLENEDYKDTEQYARKALEVDPNKASAHYLLARSMEKTNKLCEAAREFQTALDHAANVINPGFNVDNTRKKMDQMTAMCNGTAAPEMVPPAPTAVN